MGRKPKEITENPNIIYDRVGEKTDLSLCPECAAHPDCFANINGRCTGLRRVDEAETCGFFKTEAQYMAEAKRCYQRLKDEGRSDLIAKYIKPLSALGLLDDEIEAAEKYGEQFDAFRESNYQEQFNKTMEGGTEDDLLDDADPSEDDVEDDTDDEEEEEDTEDTEEDEYAGDDSWDDGGS